MQEEMMYPEKETRNRTCIFQSFVAFCFYSSRTNVSEVEVLAMHLCLTCETVVLCYAVSNKEIHTQTYHEIHKSCIHQDIDQDLVDCDCVNVQVT